MVLMDSDDEEEMPEEEMVSTSDDTTVTTPAANGNIRHAVICHHVPEKLCCTTDDLFRSQPVDECFADPRFRNGLPLNLPDYNTERCEKGVFVGVNSRAWNSLIGGSLNNELRSENSFEEDLPSPDV
ncbi:uncharacterized protein LOC144792211 [Lissotriton helveticus]